MEKDMSLKGSLNSTDKVSDSASTSSFSGEQAARLEKYVWWKLDLSCYRLKSFSIVGSSYDLLLAFLAGETNLGNARVAGLQRDLHLTNDQYSIALTVTFIPYIFAELPSNLLLKVVGPNILLSTLLVLWGVVTTLQGVVHNYAGLLACRFFLGLFEGGVLPGIVLYLSLFYPRAQLQKRLSVVFAASSLAGAFSGLLAAGISEMSGIGGRPGWAWIFILEGIFTVLFGIFSSFFIPSSPMNCRLLKQEEKEYIMLRLREDGAISKDDRNDVFSWREVFKIFYLPHVWLLFFVFFFHGTILYSLSYFAPSIIQGLGYSANRAQLMSVPPYAAAFVLTNVASYVADRYHCRGAVVMFCSACTIVGFSMFLGSHKHAVQYGSLFLTLSGINTAAPTITSWTANNTAPHIRRASAIAVVCMLTNMGGILSTWLLGSLSSAPRYTKATIVLLVFSIGLGVAAGLNVLYLWTQNKKKAEIRATITKEEEPVALPSRGPLAIPVPEVNPHRIVQIWGMLESQVYKKIYDSRMTKLSMIFSASSLAGAFSGLLAAAILHMDGIGGKRGWAWIFILEGLFTVIFGIISFFIIPESVGQCTLLSAGEKEYVLKRLREDGAIGQDASADSFAWKEVFQAFRLPHVWFTLCIFFFNGIILFTPSIVQALGWNGIQAQLMTVPPYAVGFVGTDMISVT
ncbi:hypothetical protein EYR38_009567 [Pleurotus pulmonarius]|nr:hypothetical protein EYR38_009567 [Pleurotus pulmonarius]